MYFEVSISCTLDFNYFCQCDKTFEMELYNRSYFNDNRKHYDLIGNT